jgi:hypothetical protein
VIPDHRGMTERMVVVPLVRGAQVRVLVAGQAEPGEWGSRDQGRSACQDLLAGKLRHA